jgi:carbonic anhydrase
MSISTFVRSVTVLAVTLTMTVPAFAAPAPQAAHAGSFDYDHQQYWHIESGDAQSPIAIRRQDAHVAVVAADENATIAVHGAMAPATVIDNGHTVQVVPQGIAATIRGRHFTLLQAHFHAPSEHTIDGRTFPVEGHFVFRAQDGRLAVVAVLYREGAENPQFARIMRAVRQGDAAPVDGFDAAGLLPADLDSYYHYLGSLTTPPLTENVEWYVMQETVPMSIGDIASFRRFYAHNARQVQPLNGRPLLEYGAGATH